MKSLSLLLVHISIMGGAQIDGLWLVKKVIVGTEVMTPQAKWFRLDNGKQTSGNGWQQHSFGTYRFEAKKSTVIFETENEPKDEFGAFAVQRKGNTMNWMRKEDGDNVSVELELITTLPMSTSDKVKGLWGLLRVTSGSSDVTSQYDPQKKYSIFIRWDRIYNQNTGSEKINGFWYMNAHKPELRLMRFGHEQEEDKWMVSFEKEDLVLTGLSDHNKNTVLSFKKLSEFPK
jgi:hypothetical protein